VKKIWNGKKKCISVLVLAFAVFAMAFTSAYGASGIDLNQTGKITLELTPEQSQWAELATKTYEVPLYLVAKVNVSGKYTLTDDFKNADSLKGIASVTNKTTAEEWSNFAAAAKEVVDEASKTSSKINQTATASVSGGTATVPDLTPGLYLADVPTITTDTYEYAAAPLLIAVPGNNYGTQNADGSMNNNDDWQYEVTNVLKFERNDRYGDLVIKKTIDTLNTSLGNVSFVFQVTAEKDYAYTAGTSDPTNVKTVYNNVVSIDFSADEDFVTDEGKITKSVTIKNIPAGAEVTVTEVYSGANYTEVVDGDTGKTATITAKIDDPDYKPAKVEFSNTYNNTLIAGGTAVVNHFSYSVGTTGTAGSWKWTETIGGEDVTPTSTSVPQTSASE
jgi:hypothetical protein